MQDPLSGQSARLAGKPSPSPLALSSCSCPVSLSCSSFPGPMACCKSSQACVQTLAFPKVGCVALGQMPHSLWTLSAHLLQQGSWGFPAVILGPRVSR